jgi:hypothetical protein
MVRRAKAFMLEPVREHSDSGDPWVRALLDHAINGQRPNQEDLERSVGL